MKSILTFLCGMTAFMAVAGAGDFVLVDNQAGLKPAPIIVFKDAPPRTREAAVTLAHYIEKFSGAKPAVIETLFPETDFALKHPEETVTAADDQHLFVSTDAK